MLKVVTIERIYIDEMLTYLVNGREDLKCLGVVTDDEPLLAHFYALSMLFIEADVVLVEGEPGNQRDAIVPVFRELYGWLLLAWYQTQPITYDPLDEGCW